MIAVLDKKDEILQSAYEHALTFQLGDRADYIPQLAEVDPELFGVAICSPSGEMSARGDATTSFTLQSIAKVFAYASALEIFPEDYIVNRVGVEASGEVFNSIIKLDRDKRPFNPMVNAGAIAVTDLLVSNFGSATLENTLEFFARMLGKTHIEIDEAVFSSEMESGERNRAIGHLLKNFKLLDNDVDEVLNIYFRHCSIMVDATELAKFGALLANDGVHPETQDRIIAKENLQRILSIMLTCGMYNYAGRWAYEVGVPAKSGVSGGLLAVAPGKLGIAAYSPRIDQWGSSVRGVAAVSRLSEDLQLHILG